MGLADKGKRFLIFGVFMITAGFAFDNYFLLILSLVLFFMAVISLPAFDLSLNIEDLEVRRELEKNKLFKDDFLHVKVIIKNNGSKRFDFLEIYDQYNEEIFRRVLGEHFISTRINPFSEVRFSYVLAPRIRGEQKIGPIKVIVKDRLGFNAEERLVPNSVDDILVYPPYEDIRKIEAMGSKRAAGINFGVHRSKQKGIGSDFYGMRKYIVGDEFRKIDWKASARIQELVVREFETERTINLIILLDASESMLGGEIENTKFEFAVRAAMLLSKIALERHDNVGVFVFSDEKNCEFLRPASGSAGQFFKVLDFLARIRPRGSKKFPEAMDFLAKRYRKRSLMILLSDLDTKEKPALEGLKKLRSLGHEVVIISPFSPWFEILGLENMTATDKALAEAIAENMMEHILKIKSGAQRMNIPLISVGPEEMLDAVLTEYLQAKKKGKAY
ncbi:MAG TPA: DUF58 domain-containing protein [Candidatus Lokiarchaeia archaeon]|nr:DUF58 domain-containing protein [Candidatus Lokiarchaeia archaeon]